MILRILRKIRRLFTGFFYPLITALILALTSPFRKRHAENYFHSALPPQKILISFFGRGLGDCIYFSGLLPSLRNHFRNAKIHLAILDQMKSFFDGNPCFDELICCPDYRENYWGFMSSALRLRKNTYDLLLSPCPTNLMPPAVWDFLIKKRFSIGIGDSLKQLFYDLPLAINWKVPFYESMLEGLAPLKINFQEPAYWIPAGESLGSLLADAPFAGKAVVLAPGGKRNVEASKDYQWIFPGFPFIIEKLVSSGYPVILTGAPYDKDCIQSVKSHPLLIDLIGKTSISQIFTLVREKARLVVCNNSGILHIAAALHVPTVSYADPEENMLRWPAYPPDGKTHIFLQDEVNRKVTPEEFWQAVLKQLGMEKPN